MNEIHLHQFEEPVQILQGELLLAYALEEVVNLIEQESSLADSHFTRVESDLRAHLCENTRLLGTRLDEEARRTPYALNVLYLEFIAPALGIAVAQEKEKFEAVMRRVYRIPPPLYVQFRQQQPQGEAVAPPGTLYDIGDMVSALHEDDATLRATDAQQARVRTKALELFDHLKTNYSPELHLLAIAYRLLAAAFGYDQDISARFDRAIAFKPAYVLVFPWTLDEDAHPVEES
jgi:hypothetical protein